MTTLETVSGAGEALPAPAEIKTAVTGLLAEFNGFADDVSTRLQAQEDRMTKLQSRMTHMTHRPLLAADADAGAPHQKAFAAYLRSGDEAGFRDLALEGKAMTGAVAADGGVLLSPQAGERIRQILVSTASLRSVASVANVEGASLDFVIDRGEIGAGWASEATTAETSTGILEKINLPLHELAAQPKASQRLLDDSAFDVETWLAERIAERFARAESAAFVGGNGTDKPRGVLSYPVVADGAWAWGSLGFIPTGTAGALSTIDPLVDIIYALDARYRPRAVFLMNSRTTAAVRKLKDADGRFLWSDSLSAGEPARLMGYKVLICEDMPDIGPDSLSIAFGDFQAGYTIVERPDLRVLRDPYSAKPHVLFYATKRVGGGVTDFAAIKLLRFSAS
jgi:HK97 family phage major capsid protein